MSPRVRHVLGGKRSGTPISNEGSCLPQRAISFGCVFCPRPRSSRVPQHDAITHRPHSTIHVAAAFGIIDPIAVTDIKTTLGAVLPDRVLDEPGEGLRKGRIELP